MGSIPAEGTNVRSNIWALGVGGGRGTYWFPAEEGRPLAAVGKPWVSKLPKGTRHMVASSGAERKKNATAFF